jgi:hypothetical protein
LGARIALARIAWGAAWRSAALVIAPRAAGLLGAAPFVVATFAFRWIARRALQGPTRAARRHFAGLHAWAPVIAAASTRPAARLAVASSSITAAAFAIAASASALFFLCFAGHCRPWPIDYVVELANRDRLARSFLALKDTHEARAFELAASFVEQLQQAGKSVAIEGEFFTHRCCERFPIQVFACNGLVSGHGTLDKV